MVSGHGAANPDVMLVADFARAEDLKTGYALSGYTENLLRQLAKESGLNYNDFYRTCLVKADLPKLEPLGKKKPSETEVARRHLQGISSGYAETLRREIEILQPNLVVPLGEMSFQFLAGLEGIRKFRGSILRLDPIHRIEKYTKLLPILGPYPYLYQDPKQKIISQLDFNKISKWSGDRPIPDDTYRIWVCRTSTELRNFLERSYESCRSLPVEKGGFLVFDIETSFNIPTCIGLCLDGFESCCIPLIDDSIDLDQRVLMMQILAKLLASDIPKVNQNIKYDWKTLRRYRWEVENVVGDTLIRASCLYPEFPKNLGFLTSIYTDIPYFKDEGHEFDPSKHRKDQFYLYNAKDCLASHQIYTAQIPEIKEMGVGFIEDRLTRLIPIYMKSEERGVRLDLERREVLLAKYHTLYHIYCLNLSRLVGRENLNPASSTAMATLVFEELGYPRNLQGVKGTDVDSFAVLLANATPKHCTNERGQAILRVISRARKFHKVIEVLELDIYPDGRFRHEANLAGTETGRTSGGQTTDYFLKPRDFSKNQKIKKINLGHSLQTLGKHGFWIEGINYGKDLRSMFVPSPGYSFVEIDLSGAEARVDRVLSGNFDMGVFDDPGIHRLTGSWVFKRPPSEIKKGTPEYDLSKMVRHAGERNIKENTLFVKCQKEDLGLNLSKPEVKGFLADFHAAEPQMRDVYHRDIIACINATRALVCPNGRRRDFFDYRPGASNHGIFNEGISYIPQAVVSDQVKFSFLQTCPEAPWAEFLVEMHDGALFEVPKERDTEFVEIYQRNVETPIDFRSGSLPRDYQLIIPSDASAGFTWEESAMKGIRVK